MSVRNMVFALMAVAGMGLSGVTASAVHAETLTAGIEGDYPPWAWVEAGEPKGIAIEAMRAIAKDQGLEVKFVDLPWPALIPALADSKLDLLVTGLVVSEDRSQIIDFTIPWFESNDVIMVPESSDKNIFTAVCCGTKVGVQAGSANQKWMEAQVVGKDIDIELKPYPDVITAVSDMLTGRVDAVNLSGPTADDIIARGREIKIVGGIQTRLPMAMAVPKGDPKQLLAKLNRGLLNIYKSGEWGSIFQKYMPHTAVVPIPAAMPKNIRGYDGPIPGMD